MPFPRHPTTYKRQFSALTGIIFTAAGDGGGGGGGSDGGSREKYIGI